MKVTYEDLRAIRLNSTKGFQGTYREMHSARVLAGQLPLYYPEEGRKYKTKIDHQKGIIYITALKENKICG